MNEYLIHLNIQTERDLTETDIQMMVANLVSSLENGDTVEISHYE